MPCSARGSFRHRKALQLVIVFGRGPTKASQPVRSSVCNRSQPTANNWLDNRMYEVVGEKEGEILSDDKSLLNRWPGGQSISPLYPSDALTIAFHAQQAKEKGKGGSEAV